MTDPLFQQDAYLTKAMGTVVSQTDRGGVVLENSVFYPTGGCGLEKSKRKVA